MLLKTAITVPLAVTAHLQEGDFPWRYSMCGWTMASERHCVMIVNDVLQDARFCQSPVAKKYGVRFYVGAPLVSSNGHRLGTLCFADSQPRVFDDTSMKLLCNFGELVTRALESDIVTAHQQEMSRPKAALQELEAKHQYRMLLRSVDCVNRLVW
jgi:GAF domain-containing protein